MNTFEEVKALSREKSGKKLLAFSVVVFLIIAVIVFLAVFRICAIINLKQMDEYFAEIPTMVENLKNELSMYSRVYEDDVATRTELGRMLFEEENALTDAERLEDVRGTVSADSVSLLDEQGKVIATTGPASPEAVFSACVQTLEPQQFHLELFPATSADGEETGKHDGRGFMRIPLSKDANRSLVFEFSCDMVLELYDDLDDWSDLLSRIIFEKDIKAYARTGDRVTGYSLDEYEVEKTVRSFEELEKVFEDADSFRDRKNGTSTKVVKMLRKRYLATLKVFSDEDTEVLLAIPLINVIKNGICIAVAISAFIGCGIVLFQIYVLRRLRRQKEGKEPEADAHKGLWRRTWPGIAVVLAVTMVFSGMLLLLDNRSNAAFTAMNKRLGLQYRIDERKDQEGTIRSTFVNCYQDRARMLADFLAEHPDCQTREGLKELSRVARTEYLMRFDRNGQELVSSNSYTGFSVGANLSEDYRAVLLGYPSAVVGPEADPYSGKTQLGTAVMMADAAGQPDGFLLAVYSAGDLNAELKRLNYENTVNSFVVQKGQVAAAVGDADGCFIAHTDPDMIGQKAEDYLPGFEVGSSFEGFNTYNGKQMCVSANAADGRTLLFMTPQLGDANMEAITDMMALAVLLILALLYMPIASRLVARAMEEAEGKLEPNAGARGPMAVFSDGYSVFMTVFAIAVLIASYNRWWTSFDYVFSRQWSKGVHLFSIWEAVFVLALTTCFKFLIRTGLRRMEDRLSLQGKTVSRLANSLISYAANFFLVFYILSMFGVNTTTLLASAGVVSIAVGMGAQSMASDLLAGFFMMLEGSVHVGDRVCVWLTKEAINGHVTDMGIRTTEITDDQGNVVIINNSKVNPLRNMSRNPAPPETEETAQEKK